MKNNSTRQNNQHRSASLWRQTITPIAVVAVVSFLAYGWLFLQQDSLFGFVDNDGVILNRNVDLLAAPPLLSGVFGDGTLPIAVLDRVPLVLAAAFWLCLAFWIGLPLVQMSLGGITRCEQIAYSALAGLAILSTTTLIIGFVGGLSGRLPLCLSILGLAIAATVAWKRGRHSSCELAPALPDTPDLAPRSSTGVWMARLVPATTCLLAASYLGGSLLPPWEFDVVEYHAQAPREFHESGSIEFVPHNIYSNMPLGAEMHTLAAMTILGGSDGWWWGSIVGKTVTGSYSLLAALLIGGFIARTYSKWFGWAAAGLFLAVPGNTHVALAGLIDMAVGSYVLATLLTMVSLRRSANKSSLDNRAPSFAGALLASTFAGAAAACKYPGLVIAVLPLMALLAYQCAAHFEPKQMIKIVGATCLGLLLTCIPWYAKNFALTGNPIYPLAYGLFGGLGITEAGNQQWAAAHAPQATESGFGPFSPRAILESTYQVLVSSPFLNPAVVYLAAFGAIVGIVSRRWKVSSQVTAKLREPWFLGAFVLSLWIMCVWWFATHRIDRFWLPCVPLVACIAAAGLFQVARLASGTFAAVVALAGISYGTIVCLTGAGVCDNRMFVSLSAIKDDFYDVDTPGLISPVAAWANVVLNDGDSKLALIGEAKAFPYTVPIVYATCFNEPPMQSLLKGRSANEQRQLLAEQGITHLLFNWTEIERYRSPGNYGFSDWPQQEDADQLLSDGVTEAMATPFEEYSVQVMSVVRP